MKEKHLAIRIEQCLALAKASNCPRRKFGAMLLDPDRNVILMDGYNGGPRGGKGPYCAGNFCERDGLKLEDLEVKKLNEGYAHAWRDDDSFGVRVKSTGLYVSSFFSTKLAAEEGLKTLSVKYPGVPSGTHMEIGCHHAEANVICNCAASGVKSAGAWLIVTGEPCGMCAKLIHHAGIVRVYVVKGGYSGPNGIDYLTKHGVEVKYVDGPQDPRM